MSEQKRPNILFILTDQHRYDCVGANGNEIIKTPTLDGLADEGMRFERSYSCCALCSPARASLITGLLPHNHHLIWNTGEMDALTDWECLPDPCHTLAGRLSDAGYWTGYTGKWHLGRRSPIDHGFHRLGTWEHEGPGFRGGVVSRSIAEEHKRHDTSSWRFRNRVARKLPNGRNILYSAQNPGPEETSYAHQIANTAIDLMKDLARDPERPFFISTNFFGPHLPFRSNEPYSSMYDPGDMKEWPAFCDEAQDKPRLLSIMRGHWDTADLPWEWWQPVVANYFAFISQIDAQIGRMLDCLSALGLADDTVVVYTTDHGDTCGDRRCFDKGHGMYDEIYHTPLIVRWPGQVAAGSVNRDFVSTIDLGPTWLDIGGGDAFANADGRSLAPLLQGNTPGDWRRDHFAEFHGQQWSQMTLRSLQDERFKYVFNGTDIPELYDMENDPAELHNLTGTDEHKDVEKAMHERLFQQMHENGDFYAGWLAPKPGA